MCCCCLLLLGSDQVLFPPASRFLRVSLQGLRYKSSQLLLSLSLHQLTHTASLDFTLPLLSHPNYFYKNVFRFDRCMLKFRFSHYRWALSH